MKKFLTALIAVFTISFHLYAQEAEYSDDIDAKEAAKMVKEDGAVIIDVRDPREFLYAGHAVGSINIPIFFVRIDLPPVETRVKVAQLEKRKEKAIHVKKIYRPMMDENRNFVKDVKKAIGSDLEKPVILICRSGERSVYAANKLAKNGFENVFNMEGGFIFDWKTSGMPWGGE